MADQTTPSSAPAATPTTVCRTAHRLEDGRVLATAEDHELHAIEQELRSLEDAALITETAAPSAPKTEASTDV